MKHKILFGLVLLLCCMQLSAQQRTITGKVTNASDGAPLVGASVLATVGPIDTVKSTAFSTIGAGTGIDGIFSISIPSNYRQLRISAIGFETQTISIPATVDVINIALVQATGMLQDVVVVGYSSQRKA